jgi:hypothetical protein
MHETLSHETASCPHNGRYDCQHFVRKIQQAVRDEILMAFL